uniref:Transmembrane protein n=1 Tax=Pithovirus LCPAC202 TaxID=2506592 RepID=A0A481Z7U0_9VIRU|nr:MAG: hypothetical protein LCPAC202_01540 [Pithovirus LCPAC202]
MTSSPAWNIAWGIVLGFIILFIIIFLIGIIYYAIFGDSIKRSASGAFNGWSGASMMQRAGVHTS